jgi:DNA-binding NtrC family response regulator
VYTIEPDHPTRVLVGQGPSCELKLTDKTVSRRHIACEVQGDTLRLTDLESTNGTTINGVRVSDAQLAGGETVKLGSTEILVERGAEPREVPLTADAGFGRVIGASTAMRRLYPLCKQLAASSVPVVIEGETGTGKEVLAEALHEKSPRARKPFVVFDCTAVPPNLVESALFGHEKGAFTGATESRRGVFEEANGGTLLIDEIGDLDIELQAKLLRALERSEVCRIGSNRWTRVDVRILAATRRDLDHEVQAERFRDDLFYRLAVTRIEMPPLRRRQGDIALLAHHFWKQLAEANQPIPADFIQRLETYSWPGNVRELQNAVARRVALGELANGTAPWALREELPQLVTESSGAGRMEQILEENLPLPLARKRVVETFEMLYLERVLDEYDGNVARAAAAAGVARRYFRLLRARNRARKG